MQVRAVKRNQLGGGCRHPKRSSESKRPNPAVEHGSRCASRQVGAGIVVRSPSPASPAPVTPRYHGTVNRIRNVSINSPDRGWPMTEQRTAVNSSHGAARIASGIGAYAARRLLAGGMLAGLLLPARPRFASAGD